MAIEHAKKVAEHAEKAAEIALQMHEHLGIIAGFAEVATEDGSANEYGQVDVGRFRYIKSTLRNLAEREGLINKIDKEE